MKILFNNKEIVESNECYLHDSSVISLEYKPLFRKLTINLETLLYENSNSSNAEIIFNNVQYFVQDNQGIDIKGCEYGINGWELVELEHIREFHNINIFNEQKPFAVMFDFFCQAKLYVVATEIQFNRI